MQHLPGRLTPQGVLPFKKDSPMTTPTVPTSPTAMSSDTFAQPASTANVERVKQFFAAWDVRPLDQDQIELFIASDYMDHNRPPSDPALPDRAVLLGLTRALATGLDDGIHRITLVEAVGLDKVLVYWRFTGTHTGELFGIPPTGRQVDIVGTDLLTLRDGQIVEHRHVEELQKLFEQLVSTTTPTQ